MPEAIRLRLTPRDLDKNYEDVRRQFWRSLHLDSDSPANISKLEGKLCREFSRELRLGLLSEIAAPIREIEKELFNGEFRSLEHLMFRYFDRPSSKYESDQAQIFDALTRHLDQRQEMLRSDPGVRRIQDKIARAGSIYFHVRIAGYSSLNLDVSVSSLSSLAEIFDRDFESFRIFLDAFVPHAFGRVFQEQNSDMLEFSTQIPPSFETAFATAPLLQPTPQASTSQPAEASLATSSREKAEWLWKLVNGSLLVPFLIALFVMYQGMTMLTEIRELQLGALKPVLEHQLKLLEEDRLRFRENNKAEQTPKK